MDARAAASAALAQKRAKQAAGAARKLSRLLAQIADGFDSFGTCEVRGPGDIDAVGDLIRLALAEHGRVDVVLLLPSDRQNQPHGANGAKEEVATHGNHPE